MSTTSPQMPHAERPPPEADRAPGALRWLYEASRTVVGPAEPAAQRGDVVRRALLAPAVLAIVPIEHLHLPGWEVVVAGCAGAVIYNIPLAYLVFIKKRFFLARVLAFVLDGALLSGTSLFVLRGLGAANSNSDIWLAFLLFAVSGGFVLAPIGSLIYTALGTGFFVLGSWLYFPAGSQYHDQLIIRVVFFVAFGLMSLGIAQELERRRTRLMEQNRQLAESKTQLEEKSWLLEHALQAERERSRRDPLTGTLNHAGIVDELRSAIAAHGDGSALTVAMVDVDGLKAINDTFGHQTGDTVLTTVASALSYDGAVVGRYGGDEFIAVLAGAARTAATRYREQVLETLSATHLVDADSGARVPVIASVGLASYPEEAETIADLIKLSDSAMYAWRRERLLESEARGLPVVLSGTRAAALVSEIVPLLTAPGSLRDKLQLVAQRLSVAAEYDGVDIQLRSAEGPLAAQSTVANVPQELVRAWVEDLRPDADGQLTDILKRTNRPILIDDLQHDDRISERERGVLAAAGLRSGLVAPMLWQGELIGTLAVASKQANAFGPRDAQFLAAVASQVTAIVRMASLVEELQSTSDSLRAAQTETVMLLAAAAEAHDHTTGQHLLDIRTLTEALALELGYSEEAAESLASAATLHDIGKIRVPDAVLATPNHLSDEEWELMRRHAVWGAEFLAGRPGFELATAIARSHHERWDGSGYPDGLRGEAIPEAAAIVAVADSFDAIISDRPYRSARPIAEAVREITAGSGSQFSPDVVEALGRLHRRRALSRSRLGGKRAA